LDYIEASIALARKITYFTMIGGLSS